MPDSLLKNPSLSPVEAAQLAFDHYGIRGEATALAGEVDLNFYLQTTDGQAFTLKISHPEVATTELDFQASIMQYLSTQQLPFSIPEVVPTQDGSLRSPIIDANGQKRWLRLQKWVAGKVVDKVNPRNSDLLKSWGQTCGHLTKALQGFDHPIAHRFYKWNPSETLFSRHHQRYIKGDEEQAIATYFWDLFEQEILPKLSDLRKSVNYNDAHELNLLVTEGEGASSISGVIDFGDALYTHTVNELAIACAYAGMGFPDPLQAMAKVVEGFHEVFPLEEKEVEVLYGLVSARLLITVASAAWNKHQEPDNAYLLVSERPAWALLRQWRNISPALAHYTFRTACGWEACPIQQRFQNWVSEQDDFAPLVAWEDKRLCHLDLSVGSLDLGNNDNFSTVKKFQQTIVSILADKDADVGVGGYAEVRPFYTTDAYEVEGNAGAQWRTVHLGLDVWAPAQTTVFAPLAGEVFSVVNNAGDCDYGPTIILKHEVNSDWCFYTLYGHLSIASLDTWKTGDRIEKGQQIAKIGPPPENGNWPPHLHFQIMLDLLGNKGDFPGVAYPSQQKVWLSICPSPYLMFPDLPHNDAIHSFETVDILNSRSQYLGRGLSISYQQPLHIVRGYGQYLYDTTARRYLDTVNNVAHVGHEHPRVLRAAQRQMALLNTNTRYLHPNIVEYAEALLATFPPELCVVHFVNSGSEANELALRMARTITDQKDMIAVEVGYHGNTGACIDISSYKFDGKGGQGAPDYTHIVPLPDTFRGLYRDTMRAGRQYAEHVRQAIAEIQAIGKNIAGFISESILSCGGQIVLPVGYLQAVYPMIREVGGLCIADEVQVGFGRSGEAFWAFELQGVVPDIVTLGKPIGNGHPLAAVVTTQAVAAGFANGMEYFNTFGGNPVSCAIGREVLNILQEESLQKNALDVGQYLSRGLQDLQKRYPIIGDVRGPGLFLGFELVKDAETRLPAATEANYLANRMRERGVLMSTDGPDHNVIKIKPPMCFKQANADFLLENLDLVLAEDFMKI